MYGQTEEEKSRLFCWFEWSTHPFYLIGPLRMEFESRDPEIIRIYNVTTDAEVAQLKVIAPQFYNIQVGVDKTFFMNRPSWDRYYDEDIRTNRRWHDVEDWKPKYGVDGISRKVRMMTRTQMYLDNPIRMTYVSYDFAGHSSVHSDVREFSRFI